MAPADRPTELVLPDSVGDALLAHAREGAPEEVCGILVGRRGNTADSTTGDDAPGDAPGCDTPGDDGDADDGAPDAGTADVVTGHRPVANVADHPRTRYELDPAETVETIERVEAAGDGVVGFYHSHPRGPLAPSETDRRQATWRGYVYAIVVPDEGVRAWRWTGEAFVELVVRD